MPELGRNGDRLPRLEAQVKDALVLVAGEEEEILAMQGLMLTLLRRPAMDLNEVRGELHRFVAVETHLMAIARAAEETWRYDVARLVGTAEEAASYNKPLAPIIGLILAMATGIELWRQEQETAASELLLVLSVSSKEDDQSSPDHLVFDRPRSGLLFEPGSLTVRQILSSTFGSSLWFVGLFRKAAGMVRSADAAAAALVNRIRDKAAKNPTRDPFQLSTLDSVRRSGTVIGKNHVVILFLHGLISTDLGYFDDLINRLKAPQPTDLRPDLRRPGVLPNIMRTTFDKTVRFLGWPHDTLTSIDYSAHELSRLIDVQLGSSRCKLVLICHSRGGLVARATAEKLFERDPAWVKRICCCITFGTPHNGVGMAENSARQFGAYILAGMVDHKIAAYADIAAYLEHRGAVQGIVDLQPASAPGTPFIRRLEAEEWQHAPEGELRRLNIHAIGGIARAEDRENVLVRRLGRLYRRWYSVYAGEEEHDLVVPISSSTGANNGHQPNRVTCTHFEYFDPGNCAADAVTTAISLIWETTGLIPRGLKELIEIWNTLVDQLKEKGDQKDQPTNADPIIVAVSGTTEAQILDQMEQTALAIHALFSAMKDEQKEPDDTLAMNEAREVLARTRGEIPRAHIRKVIDDILGRPPPQNRRRLSDYRQAT